MNTIQPYQLVALASAVSAISVTLTKSQLFASMRTWVRSQSRWLGKLASCHYCMSHWVSFVMVAIYQPVVVAKWWPIDLLVSAFILVAISAIISGLITKLNPFHEDGELETTSPTGPTEEEILTPHPAARIGRR